MMLMVDGFLTHLDPELDHSFLLLAVPREQHT
jgi:hypothetical protein